jgi:hypothetical protein
MMHLRRAAILLAAVAVSCTESQPAAPKQKKALGTHTEIKMVTSTAKRQWLETAVLRFRLERPDIKVMIKFAGSNEEIREILQGTDKPTVFSPNEGVLLTELDAEWRARHGGSGLLAANGDEAPRALLRTPFVFLGNDNVIRPMLAASPDGQLSWATVQAESRRRQSAKLPPLRVGHVAFSKGSAGLNSVFLMGLELFGGSTLTIEEAQDDRLARKLDEIEAQASLIAPTTSALAIRFSQGGTDALDLIFTYENIASELIRTHADHWGQPMRIYYPSTTVWSDQPAAVLQADWVTPEQHAAAVAWLQFLMGRAMQEEAAKIGLRPNDAALLDMTDGPFAKLKAYGFRRDLPHGGPKPSEAVTKVLVSLAQRARPRVQVAAR